MRRSYPPMLPLSYWCALDPEFLPSAHQRSGIARVFSLVAWQSWGGGPGRLQIHSDSLGWFCWWPEGRASDDITHSALPTVLASSCGTLFLWVLRTFAWVSPWYWRTGCESLTNVHWHLPKLCAFFCVSFQNESHRESQQRWRHPVADLLGSIWRVQHCWVLLWPLSVMVPLLLHAEGMSTASRCFLPLTCICVALLCVIKTPAQDLCIGTNVSVLDVIDAVSW